MALGVAALAFVIVAAGCGARRQAPQGYAAPQPLPGGATRFRGCMSRVEVIEPGPETAPALARAVGALERERRCSATARWAHPPRPDLPPVTTIDEAAERIATGVNMAYPPALCTEWNGWFVFSGGTTTGPVRDFSTGLGIRKGDNAVYTWEAAE